MKASEMMLRMVEQAGGRVEYFQFQDWRNQLIQAGLLEIQYEGSGDGLKQYLTLTPKATAFLRKVDNHAPDSD